MPRTTQIEVWVIIDDAGDYAVAIDNDGALVEAYENEVQPVGDAGGIRKVKVILNVPLPEVATLTGDVPEQGEATLNVA